MKLDKDGETILNPIERTGLYCQVTNSNRNVWRGRPFARQQARLLAKNNNNSNARMDFTTEISELDYNESCLLKSQGYLIRDYKLMRSRRLAI